jgi:histidinol phosphatase-like enzyme (inositol monophosphatase family)
MKDESGTLMQAAAEVARRAGDVALSHFRKTLAVETKRDGTPVTVADREAESRAREWIEARFPEDGILGEEFGTHRPNAQRRWILDPIDGTKTFVRGVPLWGTLVAVARGEEILAGAAYFPAVGEALVAAPGHGCWWNGARCSVSAIADLRAATALVTDERFADHPGWLEGWRSLARGAAVSRTWGDCFGYLLVATGRAEVMVDEVLSPWDAAALLPIVQEAGGVFTDWNGQATAFGGSGIATNGALANEVRRLLIGDQPRRKHA